MSLLKTSRQPVPHEINELDWKINLSDNKDRLTEHLIAFTNHPNGGYLIYGIADTGARMIGVDQTQVESIISRLTNLGRDAIEPPLILDHAVVEYDGVPLLFVYIREQTIKPAHRKGKSIEEAWIRSGGTTRKASRAEVGSLMLNSHAPRWEELRATSLLSADEVLARLDLGVISKLLQRPLPGDISELMHWLADEKMIVLDGNGYYITNLGGIAAARELNQFDFLSRKPIRVIRYRGTNKVDTIDEMLGNKGYAVGFEGLIGYLKRMLPHSEVIQQSLREQVSVYPEIALRELIANALIHQDFSVTGAGPIIEIYDDRITFINPGSLLPSKRLDRLIGTTPESRNELLASKFRLYRICEERGTGFQKVISAVELFGMPPVLFTPLENAFQVTLYAPRQFAEMGQSERIEACYQHAVLQYVSSQTLTNTTLRTRFKVSERQRNQITNLIADAVDAGRIKRKDATSGNKFAEYVPYWA
ncbi:ATP-binding protein [Glaciimonas sp. Gout2]|uniref:ATP-binding protein n=1 Tax=unclassified Glaciimonas TaxID=2644401 RepID=UPI002B23E911|nr:MULTISPECIES: ATP-binding protein [unclassified Glaciimonas]MEB0012551.1 ATP-binding protein [Glaciimonas sp. Cout2]MEB0083902.1 ATP-binding protein [Glaciimonas sp. Gout2]